MKKTLLWATVSILILGACQEKKQEKQAKVYKTQTVTLSSHTLDMEYSATMTGQKIVEVRPQVSGLITHILIKEGQKVKKGQPLMQIDQVPFTAAVNTARAALKAAEAAEASASLHYDSKHKLHEQRVISDFEAQTAHQALLKAQAEVAQAKAALVNAENSLSYTTVRSPLDGVAGMIPYHVGALVSSSIATPLVTVSDDSRMLIYFSISEREAADLVMQYGSMDRFLEQMPAADFRMSNGKPYPLQGKVDAVSGLVDAGTGTVRMRAIFDNPDRLLRNGGTGTVILHSHKDSIIVIPQTATYELQDRVFTYRVVDGKAKSTPIEVNRLNDGTDYVVESGLNAGDVIIAEGAGLLREGEPIAEEQNNTAGKEAAK